MALTSHIFLLLGSNIGDRYAHLKKARTLIAQKTGSIKSQSAIYETAPWGKTDQDAFLNQALEIASELAPIDLLRTLKAIEKEVGRTETEHWGPRIIDIDILFYGNEVVDLPDLKVPHPFIAERRFALEPLAEIAADFISPVSHLTVSEMLNKCL